MCSTANYVLPLRRSCEVGAPPGRLCGVPSMQTALPGVRPHGASQDTEMDMAWQELMAITELQEFQVPSEGSYEPAQYTSVGPTGEFSMIQSHPEPAACELNPAEPYQGCYSEDHHASENTSANYCNTEAHLGHRMAPVSSHTQPPVVNMSGMTPGHRRPGIGHAQGYSRHLLWTGQNAPVRSVDDLESDSGLSLGSSPPLASPDNPVGVPGYHSMDMGATYSDCEPESMADHARRANIQYSMDYQNQPHPYSHSGGHMSYFSPIFPHSQTCAMPPRSVKQSGPSAQTDVFGDTTVHSRGSSQLNMHSKSQDVSTSAPLSRDERRALALKIPFPMDKIINLPVDDFNELLTQYTLTDSQLALVRDIRRRGKNKVAAQNCRKRKLESIIHLERELNHLQAQREHLAQERLEFQRSLAFIKRRLTDLYREVFSHLRDEEGQPYSVDEYSLQQTPDGNIYLVPHSMESRD